MVPMRKKTITGYTPKWWDMKFEKMWWIFEVLNPTNIRDIDFPQVFDQTFNAKNIKKKEFVKVKITIEEVK